MLADLLGKLVEVILAVRVKLEKVREFRGRQFLVCPEAEGNVTVHGRGICLRITAMKGLSEVSLLIQPKKCMATLFCFGSGRLLSIVIAVLRKEAQSFQHSDNRRHYRLCLVASAGAASHV